MKQMLALIAVYKKDDRLVRFAEWLLKHRFDLIASDGTAKYLDARSFPVERVSTWIGTEPILDHLVATLSTQVHAALLADRSNKDHMQQLPKLGPPGVLIRPIDLAFVDMYPLEQAIAMANSTVESVRQATDIGGPTIVRSAAKGRRFVIPGYSFLSAFKSEFWPEYQRPGGGSDKANRQIRAKLLDNLAGAAEQEVGRYVGLSADYLLRRAD